MAAVRRPRYYYYNNILQSTAPKDEHYSFPTCEVYNSPRGECVIRPSPEETSRRAISDHINFIFTAYPADGPNNNTISLISMWKHIFFSYLNTIFLYTTLPRRTVYSADVTQFVYDVFIKSLLVPYFNRRTVA